MRIGIDARGLNQNKAGIAIYIEEMIKQINNSKNESNEYILYSNKSIKLDVKLNKNIIMKVVNIPIGTLWLYFILPIILKKDKIDVFWGTQHCLPMRNIFTKKIKYILTVHDLANHKMKNIGQIKNTIIQKVFLGKSCKNANVIMASSKSTQNDIVDILKINREKIKIVYLGTNFSTEYNISNEQQLNILKKFNVENKNYLLFVSTIEPRKNIITLIKAFENLKENGNNDLKLILAGGLGWKYKEILETIDKSKFKNDINLAGYISKDEKQCLLHNCKCFVYPTLYEGFGLPILEAMANNAVVVTSNVSSIPEVGGEAAIYYNNLKDEKELADRINYVLNLVDNDKIRIIKLGHKQVEEFTWDNCAKQVLSIILK